MSFVNAEDEQDPALYDLIDMIEHMPSRSRLFGAGAKEYDAHIERIRDLIAAVEE